MSKLHPQYLILKERQEKLLQKKNAKTDFYNGIYDRWEDPVLTREHVPVEWRFDLDPKTNPHFMERLGVNAVFNSGAIKHDGQYCLVARVESNDRKSFFAVARSDSPVEGFRFGEKPVLLPDTCPDETNVYDMRMTRHEDGWIYGVFCSESKDRNDPDLSAAVAAAGIVRTKNLENWERLPNLVTLRSPQQRNVTLLPEFVDGKYAFFTRPADGFNDTGSGGGVGFGLCDDITHAVIDGGVHDGILDGYIGEAGGKACPDLGADPRAVGVLPLVVVILTAQGRQQTQREVFLTDAVFVPVGADHQLPAVCQGVGIKMLRAEALQRQKPCQLQIQIVIGQRLTFGGCVACNVLDAALPLVGSAHSSTDVFTDPAGKDLIPQLIEAKYCV